MRVADTWERFRRGVATLRCRGFGFGRYVVFGVAWPALMRRPLKVEPGFPLRCLERCTAPASPRWGSLLAEVPDRVVSGAVRAETTRKSTRGQPAAREAAALIALEKHEVPAPRILEVSARPHSLARSWVPGRPLIEAVQGPVADCEAIRRLGEMLDRIHAAGVTGPALEPDRIVVGAGGDPVLVDFREARVHVGTASIGHAIGRDRDRRRVNQIYGTDLLTEAAARDVLTAVGRTNYAPLDLGRGLVTRGFWSVDSGSGRWDYLNRRVLGSLIANARILDLGCHNGTMPLLMLRDGAARVTAVERDPKNVEAARMLREVFAWRYCRSFDLEVIEGDMLAALESATSRYDLVSAYCSLYYLAEEEMVAAVSRAAEITDVMVLQAKTDTRDDAGDSKAAKSSLEFLRALLANHGFPEVEVHGPRGYTRPVLIGRRGEAMG